MKRKITAFAAVLMLMQAGLCGCGTNEAQVETAAPAQAVQEEQEFPLRLSDRGLQGQPRAC